MFYFKLKISAQMDESVKTTKQPKSGFVPTNNFGRKLEDFSVAQIFWTEYFWIFREFLDLGCHSIVFDNSRMLRILMVKFLVNCGHLPFYKK